MKRSIGRGWATIELDRAEDEVRNAVGVDLRFGVAERSRILGARCRKAATPEGDWIVVLEPDTEGRLAAFLARHGEGWAATWEAGVATGAVPGPLGPELLAPDQPVRGPFRLIVTTATIGS